MTWLWQPFGEAAATGDQTVTGNLLTVTASLPNATITPGGVTVTGNLLTVTSSLPNATITTQNTITAQRLTVTASLPNATLTPGGVSITANLLTVTASLPNATVTATYTVTAQLLTVTASLPNATITPGNVNISANLLTASKTFPGATITTGNVNIATNLLSVTASLPTATVTAAATITANLLSVSVSLPNATVTPGNVTVAANLLTVSASFPLASISLASGAQTITANLLTVSASLPNATISATYSIAANLLSITASLPNATLTPGNVNITANLLTVTASFPGATITGGVATHILQNNANGGPNETQLTGGSGGNTVSGGDYFDTINGGASPSPGDRVVFSSAQKAHGTYSILTDSNSSGGEYVAWDTSWTDETSQVDVRFYFRVITFPSSAANKLMRMFDNLGNEVAYFRVDTAPNPGIGDSTATFTEPSGPVVLAANTWYRVEMHVPIGNSVTITCDMFAGANMDGTTPDYSWSQSGSDTLTVGGDVASIRWGNSIAGTETYFDDVGIRNDGNAFGAATDTATISANLLSVTKTFPNATLSATATISANLLTWPVTLPLASFSQITAITANRLVATPSLPNATISITGAQTVTTETLTVVWQAFPATITLGTINAPGSIDGSVGRRIITVGTVTELEDVAGAVTKG